MFKIFVLLFEDGGTWKIAEKDAASKADAKTETRRLRRKWKRLRAFVLMCPAGDVPEYIPH